MGIRFIGFLSDQRWGWDGVRALHGILNTCSNLHFSMHETFMFLNFNAGIFLFLERQFNTPKAAPSFIRGHTSLRYTWGMIP